MHKKIFLGAFSGIFLGIALQYFGTESSAAQTTLFFAGLLGSLFISLLKMIVIPLVFTSIANGIAHLRAHAQVGSVWRYTIVYFLCTTSIAIFIALVIVNIFQPGKGLDTLPFQESMAEFKYEHISLQTFAQEFIGRLFLNPLSAMANNKILPTAIFAILLGAALVSVGDKGKRVEELLSELFQLIMAITHWVMQLAPIGIFGLCLKLVATQDLAILNQMLLFIAIAIGATLVHGFITLPLILSFYTSIRPKRFFTGMQNALITALSTSSSSAALPVTMECVEENLGVDKDVAGFVLPIGATMNMDGTALYEAIAAIFIANLVGVELSLIQQMVVFLMSAIAAIGAPGIPSAGMTTMVMVLDSVGLPAEAIAILLPMDRFLDTFRTMVNVEGDAIGCCVIDSLIKRKS